MNEKSIPQALREQANAIEKLAQRIAREGQALPVADALRCRVFQA